VNPKTKTILAVALAAAGGAVWVPQLVGANDLPAHVRRAETPAEGGEAAVSEPAADPRSAERTQGAASAASADRTAGPLEMDGGGDAESLARTLAEAEASATARHGLDLTALLAALDPGRDAPPDAIEAPSAPKADAAADALALAAFADANPLTGTLGGPGPVALLGHRIVRAGDVLAAGRVTVERIEPAVVHLRAGDAVLALSLDAFQARRTTAASGGADPDDDAVALDEPASGAPAMEGGL
jgi:hypothetical protein